MGLKLSNNAVSVLAVGISAASTSLTLDTGHGSRFPALSSGEWFPLTVFDAINAEIVKVTARSGDVLTDPGHSHVMNKGSSTSAGAHIGKAGSIDTVTSSGMQHTGTGISINGAATGISIQSAGSGGAHNNVQPTLALTWIVKT
jgi:hypothetical protein